MLALMISNFSGIYQTLKEPESNENYFPVQTSCQELLLKYFLNNNSVKQKNTI